MYEGTPHKRKDGRWELMITIGRHEDGRFKRKSFYGKKEREVIHKKDEWLRNYNINQNTKADPLDGTEAFDVWADRWLEIKKGTVRPYTYENTYRTRVGKYLKPYFGHRPIAAITQSDIQVFFLKHKHLSEALLKTLKTILKNMFELAIVNDLCIKNPVTGIKLKSIKAKSEKTALNEAQQKKAIEWAIANRQYDVLAVIKTGMRRGELLGLRWSDINFDQKYIHVCQSMCDGIEKGDKPDMKLKSQSSDRYIPVDDELLKYLSDIPHTSDKVFPYCSARAYGTHICRVLKRMSKECELPYVTLHELRHTYGTVLREKGVDIYTIQKLLGHSSVDVTAKIYVHNDIDVLRQAMRL
ncbi:MAG: site-specific integrase [Clostridia bacterium]|nr:site-specific integrase [Clostridia bacterium]